MEEINSERKLSRKEIEVIRKLIVDAVRNIDDASGKRFKFSNLDCSKELLDRIVFDYRAKFPNGDTYKDIFYEFFKLKSKIDFDGVSFDGAIVAQRDFTGSKGIKINPQTIFFKSLLLTVCSGVEFIGPFDGVNLCCTDFTGSKGAKINPQTIYDKNLLRTVCTDVEFTGSFDNVRMNDETLLEGSNARYIDSYERVKESINKLIK